MGVGQVQIAQFEVSGPRPAAYGTDRDTAGPLADADCAHSWTDAPPWNLDQYLPHG
jgi:hypothetical protein